MASSCSVSQGKGAIGLLVEVKTHAAVLRDCVKSGAQYVRNTRAKLTTEQSYLAEMKAYCNETRTAVRAGTLATLRFRPDVQELVKQSAADQDRHFNDMRQRVQDEFNSAATQRSMWMSTATAALHGAIGAAVSLTALQILQAEELRADMLAIYQDFVACADDAKLLEEDLLRCGLDKVFLEQDYVEVVKLIQAENASRTPP
ncbi:uncharacterized protein LOC129589701 [Paramacrobiotus metropolitanus]|uniref:uncharacterized protein LOC129589701 n=1 Tax=Paramacrobiotus metropolitanus TaxID=2943436 RepID=UPI002445B43D|nr:uncharacterized protein LOC129589701 [Paramacrobiotus metropolitanus]